MTLALGIDIGTSGIRTAVVAEDGRVLGMARAGHGDHAADDPARALGWWQAVEAAVAAQIAHLRDAGHDPLRIRDLAIDGTSGTMLLVDADLNPVTPALMYDSSGFGAAADIIAAVRNRAPDPASAAARALHLVTLDRGAGRAVHLMHQADFILARFAGGAVGSDDNNALKLGWDPERTQWPGWLVDAGMPERLLPKIHRPGTALGPIARDVADALGLSPDLVVHAGTTDSIAAFLATGAAAVGDAVTSLGTTLALKLVSSRRIEDPARGVYSHRLGDAWLAGGASNTGGGALAAHFTPDAIAGLSARIDPNRPTGLDYYPLPRPGERFPVNDPGLAPRLSPRPDDPVVFLQAMMEGVAAIEAEGYRALVDLGAEPPTRIFTCGGGAQNAAWTCIRARHLPAPVIGAPETEAAVGAARLARSTLID